jgi:5-methylcytosine-specific restriction endonuclease McrA
MPFQKGHKNRLGTKLSEETKKKMSRSQLGKKRRPFSVQARKNMSESHKGIHLSESAKEKLREINKKRILDGKHNWWKGGISTGENKKNYQKIASHKQRIRKYLAEGSHTQGEWELLKKQYGFTCPRCFKKEPEISLTEDHIIPLIKGGSDYIENIQPLCKPCNSWKHIKIIKFEIGGEEI